MFAPLEFDGSDEEISKSIMFLRRGGMLASSTGGMGTQPQRHWRRR